MNLLALPTVLVAALSTSLAQAQTFDTEARPLDRPEPVAERDPGEFEHDGFYLRFGVGFGGYSEVMRSEDENPAGENSEGTVNGIGSMGDLMIGGAVSRRVILGGGFWASTVLVSEFTQEDGDDVPGDFRDPDTFTLVGPFVDWYIGRIGQRRGEGGIHAQAALGFAVLNGLRPEDVGGDDERVAFGAGVMGGFGYDWWVAEQWELGVLARVTAAGLIEEDDSDETWYHAVATVPALLFTGTYN